MRVQKVFLITALTAVLALSGFLSSKSFADNDHEHAEESHAEKGHDEEGGNHEHAGEEEHADSTKITDQSAKDMKIVVLKAGPAKISQTISLTGKITFNQDKTAQITARFPGIIKSAVKTVGDTVKKGDELATVESNQSLQIYSIKSPFDGVVIARNASAGALAGEGPIYAVADLSLCKLTVYGSLKSMMS